MIFTSKRVRMTSMVLLVHLVAATMDDVHRSGHTVGDCIFCTIYLGLGTSIRYFIPFKDLNRLVSLLFENREAIPHPTHRCLPFRGCANSWRLAGVLGRTRIAVKGSRSNGRETHAYRKKLPTAFLRLNSPALGQHPPHLHGSPWTHAVARHQQSWMPLPLRQPPSIITLLRASRHRLIVCRVKIIF